MEKRQDRILGRCILTGAVWLGLHLFMGVRNIEDNLYMTFDRTTYVWIAVYAAVLLALDGMLFSLNSRRAAKNWARYWGFCTLVCGLLAVLEGLKLQLGLWAVVPLLATPYVQFYPLLMQIFSDGSVWNAVSAVLLCGAHLLYFHRLLRRCPSEEKST